MKCVSVTLHNSLCFDVYSFVTRMEGARNAYGIFIVEHEGKRPRGRPGHKWENNIKMDLR